MRYLALALAVIRDTYHGSTIDCPEFGGGLLAGTRHARKIPVEPKEALEAHSRLRLLEATHFEPFLDFYHLVQPAVPRAKSKSKS